MRRDEVPTTAELVAAERAAQGLPRRVEDPAALERIATLVEPPRPVPAVRREDAA